MLWDEVYVSLSAKSDRSLALSKRSKEPANSRTRDAVFALLSFGDSLVKAVRNQGELGVNVDGLLAAEVQNTLDSIDRLYNRAEGMLPAV